jgi:hypothetical protein
MPMYMQLSWRENIATLMSSNLKILKQINYAIHF